MASTNASRRTIQVNHAPALTLWAAVLADAVCAAGTSDEVRWVLAEDAAIGL